MTRKTKAQRPAGAAIAVEETVDRLELGMRDRDLDQQREIGPRDDGVQVVDRRGPSGVVRRHGLHTYVNVA